MDSVGVRDIGVDEVQRLDVVEAFSHSGVREGIERDDRVVRVVLAPVPAEVGANKAGSTGNEQCVHVQGFSYVRIGQLGWSRGSSLLRRGFARSRADSTGSLTPQSAPICGSSHATPSSSAGL